MALDTERLLAQAERVAAQQTVAAQTATLPTLTFAWGGERYALPLSDVREVAKVGSITPLPGLPPTVLGAMNLRGEILPVVDLRPLLGLDSGQPTAGSRLIVVNHRAERIGLLVDGVSDIFEMPALAARSVTVSDLILGQTVLPSGPLLSLLDLPRVLATLVEA